MDLGTGEQLPVRADWLRVADLESLVLFKLYAGGSKSSLDILELLARHPEQDLGKLRERASAVGLLAQLERLLALRG